MSKKVNSFIKGNKDNLLDIDFHDFVEMIERGYKTEEIASELGVTREQVELLKRELDDN